MHEEVAISAPDRHRGADLDVADEVAEHLVEVVIAKVDLLRTPLSIDGKEAVAPMVSSGTTASSDLPPSVWAAPCVSIRGRGLPKA